MRAKMVLGQLMKTAIIGGGIAGLAAAYELEKARASGAPVEYTLFESAAKLGGSLASEIVDGAVLERGPDSFLTEKPAAAELCRELGLAADLIPSNDAARKTWILVKNTLIPLPDGLMFLVPTKLIPTALTPLFSLSTKIRMGLELLLPPRPSKEEDEAVAALVERHFGPEAVDRLADPLLSGIYGGDATQLSARSVLPRLVEMESEYGSLTRGMLAAHRKVRARAKDAAKKNGGAGPRGSNAHANSDPAPRPIFTSLRGGMQQLVNAIQASLNPAWVRLGTPVSAIAKAAHGWRVEAGGVTETCDAVIIASQAWAAGVLLSPVDAALGEDLSAILRAFLGGMKNEALLTEPDEVLVATVRRELQQILGIQAEPEYTQVSRWRRAMAQYAVGHQARAKRVAERVAALQGLKLAGNAYDGIGIPDCIRLGRTAAKELLSSQQVSESASQPIA